MANKKEAPAEQGLDQGASGFLNLKSHKEALLSRGTAALEYANQGFSVFPCNRDKSPKTKHGFKDATTDPEQIKKWWDKWPDASIGMSTGPESGIWVLDVDLYKPGAKDAFDKLIQANGHLPETRTQETGGGGRHYFFKHPGFKIPSPSNHLGPGLDIKGDGGYVIVPPSRHPSGGHYKWINESPIADAPPWLIDRVKEKPTHKKPEPRHSTGTSTAYALKALEAETANIHQAAEGSRNETLNKAAFNLGQLVAGGELSRTLVESTLFDAGITAGLSASEARKTIQSGLTNGEQSPRQAPQSNQAPRITCTEDIKPPDPLPDELLPVKPFDFVLLPESLAPWAEDISDRIQCPPDFVAAGIMTALGAIIGRKVGIRPQARTDWTVIPNLWALIVGRPGVLKSPALEAALAPLKRLIASATERYAIDESDYKTEAMAAKLKKESAEKTARKILDKTPDADIKAVLAVDDPDIPTLKRYVANDTSPASLGELLRQNPNGLLVFRDEVVSLLKSLDREGQEEGRGFYLTAWNGDSPYTFDRIGRGLNLHIPALCLSVLGGTQPGRLAEYIRHAVRGGAADDGLIQRFGLLVWPDTNGPWKDVDRWPDTKAKNRAFEIFERLDNLQGPEIGAEQDTDINGAPDGPPFLRFDPASLELFQEWRTNLEKRLRGELHPAIESHFAKYRKLIPSLALICHLTDGGTGPVSERATLQAMAWSEYLESHAKRAYGSVSQPETSVAKAILKRIKKGDLKTPFSSKDVWRPGWAKLSDRDQVIAALRLLEDYGWLDAEIIKNTGGRPKTEFHLNKEAKI